MSPFWNSGQNGLNVSLALCVCQKWAAAALNVQTDWSVRGRPNQTVLTSDQ